jgi:hypothetical protein
MARRESFDKTALRLISGTPFSGGEFYRVIHSTGVGEYVKVVNRQVVKFTRELHDDNAAPVVTSVSRQGKVRLVENDMELRGTVLLDGTPVEYYGTQKGWEKFKSEWTTG